MKTKNLVIFSPLKTTFTRSLMDLGRHGFDVKTVGTVEMVDAASHALNADACVFFWRAPYSNSLLDCLRSLRASTKTNHIGFVVLADDSIPEPKRIRALEAGADDVVVASVSLNETSARLHAILRARSSHQPEAAIEIGDLVLDSNSHRVFYEGKPISVCNRGFTILELFLKNPGIVFSRSYILDQIRSDPCQCTRVVDVAIHRLRGRLGDAGEMIETVRGVGYRFVDRHNPGRSVVRANCQSVSRVSRDPFSALSA